MPRNPEDQDQSNFTHFSSNQNDSSIPMEIEPENLNEQATANQIVDEIPDLTGIEDEEYEDKSGNKYIPERFAKCFIPQNEEAKKLTSIALKYILCQKKFDNRKIKHNGPVEVYIINSSWFKKWKDYSRYPTLKRIIKSYITYVNRPITFTPNKKIFPGIINNKDLLISNRIKDESRNILISKDNTCLDTKLVYKKDFKLLPKERFDLLNDYFKSDIVLKAYRKEINGSKSYNAFCAHLRLVFIPRIELFKNISTENIDEFKKKHNIIYDIYLNQTDGKKEILNELAKIIKEKPQILTDMGVEFILENDEDEIFNHVKNFAFYIPNSQNSRSAKEISDLIFSNESIEKIKKDEKISDKDIELSKVEFSFDINSLFKLNWIHKNNNYDEIERGIFFLEYIPMENNEQQNSDSIFDIKDKINHAQTSYEEQSAYRGSQGANGGQDPHHNSQESYNLDNFPLDKEKNKHGLVGLNNLGNTCYMNTGLQCLSNCELLTKYFLNDYYKEYINKDNPIGSQGEIVEKYSQLIHHLWYGDNECISPMLFKVAFGKMYNSFNDFRQQDTQEFISYLLDALHEDLNKVKTKPYLETNDLPENLSEEELFKIKKELYLCRNQSFIADLICGFYKSTVYCPGEKCNNISKSFEPFNMITLSLINEAQLRKLEEYQDEQNKKMGIRIINVTFIPFKINYKPLKFPIKIKKEMDIFSFKKKIEVVTGFNKNSFEIYKMQSREFMCIKPDIIMLDDFLKGENKIFLFQIPPYVFGKPLNYFDKVYEKLNCDHDKFFLEEEKYEGNDLYNIYNRREEKSETDNIENNPNRINENADDDEEKKENENNEEKIIRRAKDDEDIEMKDDSLNLDRNKWIKAEFYNYSYSNEKSKNKSYEECRINNSRIVYIDKEWDNASIYQCIMDMLDGTRNDLPEIKNEWFKDLKEVTKTLGSLEKKKKNLLNYFEEKVPNHPLILQYLGVFNYNNSNIMTKEDGWKNLVFPFEIKNYLIQKIVNKAQIKNDIKDIELMFKIIWKPIFSKDYNEGTTPTEFTKSERLEEIFKNQKEEEYLKKSNIINIKENDGKNNKKKLKLEELLKNFNEIEKLSKDNKWYCPKCKQFQLADKKLEIYSVNEVIIIHLKRFRNNRKIYNFVEYPIEGLDLGQYLPNKNEKIIFDLFAVANHVGGLYGGHYFAYCKNHIDGGWYEFNDSHVNKIETKKVVNDNAYVLFYKKRRDEKFNEEELFKKPFIEIDYSKYVKKK